MIGDCVISEGVSELCDAVKELEKQRFAVIGEREGGGERERGGDQGGLERKREGKKGGEMEKADRVRKNIHAGQGDSKSA